MAKFTKDFLVNKLGLPYGDGELDVEIIEDKIYDTTRWSICYELIFKYEDKCFMVDYEVGATEMQEERPFEHYSSSSLIECTEVEKVEVISYEWKPVKNKTEGVFEFEQYTSSPANGALPQTPCKQGKSYGKSGAKRHE